MTEIVFPQESYPVMYKMFWNSEFDDSRKIENNRLHNTVISSVYTTYYNIVFDTSTLDEITYTTPDNSWKVVIKILYLNSDGGVEYLWEYFDNWVSILNLNRY